MQATRSDLKVPGWLMAAIWRRSAAMSGPIQTILAGAALTDILLRFVDMSRAAASRRTRTTDIDVKLREFERAWEQETGEQLSTAAFYDRFCAGDCDTRFGASWATYYEATLGRPAARAGLAHLGLHRPTRD